MTGSTVWLIVVTVQTAGFAAYLGLTIRDRRLEAAFRKKILGSGP